MGVLPLRTEPIPPPGTPGQTTILRADVVPGVVPPGKLIRVTYRWEAVPLDKDYKVFVHGKDVNGAMIFQNDHEPPFPGRTSTWNGALEYTLALPLPSDLPDGVYRLEAGLYDPKSGRVALNPGEGVRANPDLSYVVGTVTVDAGAPPPRLDSDRPPTLDLTGYRLTFQDAFDGPLDASADGPGTKWTTHTPYHGDFGDAAFGNPGNDSPFSVKDGVLTIEARQRDGKWTSGLLCSVDPQGKGFAQKYGYFEVRAKFPEGAGTWPAIWLQAVSKLHDPKQTGIEVDVVEQYGLAAGLLHATLHWWYPDQRHDAVADLFAVADMTRDFHRYGFLYDKQKMVWYFDGVELWRQPTPPEAKVPLYLMVNLALGGGWPIDKTPNPSRMLVDYVRVYARTEKGAAETSR